MILRLSKEKNLSVFVLKPVNTKKAAKRVVALRISSSELKKMLFCVFLLK